jgi:uncharacterized protein
LLHRAILLHCRHDQGILPDRLDVKAFAQVSGHLSGHDSLLKYERLAQEAKGLHPDLRVDWTATGELRTELGDSGRCGCT